MEDEKPTETTTVEVPQQPRADPIADKDDHLLAGFCRFQIVGLYGNPRTSIGSAIQVPVHAHIPPHPWSDLGVVIIRTYLPRLDLVRLLKLQGESWEILTATWYRGAAVDMKEPFPENRVLALLESCPTREQLTTIGKNRAGVLYARAHCPLLLNSYNRPMKVEIEVEKITDYAVATLVTLSIPERDFKDIITYSQQLREPNH